MKKFNDLTSAVRAVMGQTKGHGISFRRKGRPSPSEELSAELSPALLTRGALRNILLVAAAGVMLLVLDLAASGSMQRVGIVQENGQIFLERPEEDEDEGHLALKARVRTDAGVCEQDLDVILAPRRSRDESAAGLDEDPLAGSAQEDAVRSELRSIASDLNTDTSAGRVALPLQLSSGEDIRWSLRRENNAILILFLTIASAAALYARRLAPLTKQRKAREAAILRSLPEFIDQLVLLLNAGLVLSRAFQRTVEEGMRFRNADADWFYRQMQRIDDSVQNTNGSITAELHAFARDSGVRELIRVSSILRDNISKGASLNAKLERESESLWISRRLRYEEQGRLAETKMTLPLSVFLCVLIIITVAPALLTL